MSLTHEEIELIRDGFAELRKDIEPRSVAFYQELFRLAPELRPMFRDDIAGQGMRFMSTLAILLNGIEQPERLAARFVDLGHSHRALGVKAAHFEPMGEALILTLSEALGDDFTPRIEEIWRRAYRELADAIIKAGKIEN